MGNYTLFYNGLNYNTCLIVDVATRVALMKKSIDEALGLTEDMAFNHH